MIAGLIIVPVVSLITKKPEDKEVDSMFEVFDEQVTVKRRTALSQNEDEN